MNAVELYNHPSSGFAAKLEQTTRLLKAVEAEFSPLTQASSLGVEDMVVTHLVHATGVQASVFVLDTGMLHPETLQLIPRLEERYGLQVDLYRPDALAVRDFVQANGSEAMYRSIELRKQCCHIRKLEPLERALAGKRGWLTGLRREQSNARSEVELVEHQDQRVKINPLAHWTNGDVWHYVATQGIPYNPLHDRFFPSIGCAPCTRAVTLGEDPRSGRWWWEQESAKECGLHAGASTSIIPIREIA